MSCGNEAHPEECLCDVRLHGRRTTRYLANPIRDSLFGREIAEYLGISAPYSTADVLAFFEMQVMMADRLAELRRADIMPKATMTYRRCNPRQRVTDEQREFIANRVAAGDCSAVIRTAVKVRFNVSIGSDHMAHLRRRMGVKR